MVSYNFSKSSFPFLRASPTLAPLDARVLCSRHGSADMRLKMHEIEKDRDSPGKLGTLFQGISRERII